MEWCNFAKTRVMEHSIVVEQRSLEECIVEKNIKRGPVVSAKTRMMALCVVASKRVVEQSVGTKKTQEWSLALLRRNAQRNLALLHQNP